MRYESDSTGSHLWVFEKLCFQWREFKPRLGKLFDIERGLNLKKSFWLKLYQLYLCPQNSWWLFTKRILFFFTYSWSVNNIFLGVCSPQKKRGEKRAYLNRFRANKNCESFLKFSFDTYLPNMWVSATQGVLHRHKMILIKLNCCWTVDIWMSETNDWWNMTSNPFLTHFWMA